MFASRYEIMSVVNKQYVYVLRSNWDLRFYVGLTRDVVGRLQQHKDGKVTSTKARGPLALIYWKGCLNRSDAAQHERYLKSAPILEDATQELSHGVNGNIAFSQVNNQSHDWRIVSMAPVTSLFLRT